MEFKDIEDFFKKVENFLNFYNIGLFFAVVILLYITVIGALIVSIVNDKTYTEEVKTGNVKKIMQNIIDINNIVIYVLFGLFITVFGIVALINKENTLNALVDNKFTLLVLIVSIAVMVAMNSLCKYIKDIKETDLYKHGSGMLGGGISAIIVIVVVFIWYRKNTSRPIIPTTSRTIATTSTPIIPTQRLPALPTSRTFPTQRLPALPTSRTIAAAAA